MIDAETIRMIEALRGELDQLRSISAPFSAGTWTPTWTGLTVTGSPIFTGYWTRIGSLVHFTVSMTPNGGTYASTTGATFVNNLPFTPARDGAGVISKVIDPTGLSGVVSIWSGRTQIYTPTFAANGYFLAISVWISLI